MGFFTNVSPPTRLSAYKPPILVFHVILRIKGTLHVITLYSTLGLLANVTWTFRVLTPFIIMYWGRGYFVSLQSSSIISFLNPTTGYDVCVYASAVRSRRKGNARNNDAIGPERTRTRRNDNETRAVTICQW